MRGFAALLALVALLAAPLAMAANHQPERVVAGLSQNQVAITANFVGSEILVFGAIRRETAAPGASDLDVVVTIAAPSRAEIVRRMERRFGIWMNTDSVRIGEAPPFYAVASTRPLAEMLSPAEDLVHAISIGSTIRAVSAEASVPHAVFIEALQRLRLTDGLFADLPGAVDLAEDTLFQARIALPANLVEGDYLARIFLVRDGLVVDRYETLIDVQKVGLSRLIYRLAHDLPLIYGLLSLAIAIAAGWLASAAFRLFRA
ncbi:MAG: TIGR02186 family protein [Rhodobacteraceae bacterium]|nr:TIGR02186 family protein [Paracoccaceae bacterium]